jgi:uncharacterized OsmC-like protein
MARITIRPEHDDHYHVGIRHHGLVVDQPAGDAADLGPTPTELFVAGLAACVAFYAGRYFRRHQIDAGDWRVDCDFQMSEDRPARVTGIAIDISLPAAFPEKRREPLQRVIEACTVHNTLMNPPAVRIMLHPAAVAGGSAA